MGTQEALYGFNNRRSRDAFPSITDRYALINGGTRPNVSDTTAVYMYHRSVALCRSRFSTIGSPTCHTRAHPLPSIVSYLLGDRVLSTHVRATYATRGPQYRDRGCATSSLLIFTRRFAGTPTWYGVLKARVKSEEARRRRRRQSRAEPSRVGDPFESTGDKKGRGTSPVPPLLPIPLRVCVRNCVLRRLHCARCDEPRLPARRRTRVSYSHRRTALSRL